MIDTNKTVACPSCKKTVVWAAESTYRPFCSERCRLIDLGEWLEEEKCIPGQPHFPAEAQSEE